MQEGSRQQNVIPPTAPAGCLFLALLGRCGVLDVVQPCLQGLKTAATKSQGLG